VSDAGAATLGGILSSDDTPLGRAFAAVDLVGERWSAALRGRRWADAGAGILSNLSDYGVVWVLAAGWKARRPGPARRRAIVALALSGFASYGVNRAAKKIAGRSRPEVVDGARDALPVRTPASSSFPSGHTLASFSTAVVLPDLPSTRGLGVAFAAAVAASRVHLRAHHTSDVLGGAIIGAVLGTMVRPIVDALAPRDISSSAE
jgi:undecaprenyl-diphosphatase